jgi:hypothetical protein
MPLPREEIFLEAALQQRQCDELAMFPGHLRGPLPTLLPRAHQQATKDAHPNLVTAVCQWQTLGFVLDVPLMALYRPLVPPGVADSRALAQPPGTTLTLAGLFAASRLHSTSRGKTMQFLTLADEWGLIEATLFPDISPLLPHPALGPYLITGRLEDHFGARTITATQPPILLTGTETNTNLTALAPPALAPAALAPPSPQTNKSPFPATSTPKHTFHRVHREIVNNVCPGRASIRPHGLATPTIFARAYSGTKSTNASRLRT